MAVYRIYPEKDTTIWSEPTLAGLYGNAGLDQILEIGGYPDLNGVGRSKRSLIQFNSTEINSTLNQRVTGNYSASLNLYIANASEIPEEYSVHVNPVSSSWFNGTGRLNDKPVNRTGVSWKFKDTTVTQWTALGGDYLVSPTSSQLHTLKTNHDLNIDVTSIVNGVYSGSIANNGMLLKIQDSYENYTTQSINLKYFSSNTSTIFKPYLEFKWDDSTFVTGSLATLSTDNATITIKNGKESYSTTDNVRFRISSRPKHPVRSFSTSSIYLTEYALPSTSQWAIKDEFSEEMIIDFDEQYTKISTDGVSSYFDLEMNMLQPDRYYRLLVKTTIDNSTFIIDQNNTFKVVKNV